MDINSYKKRFEALYKELQKELGTTRPIDVRIFGEMQEHGMEMKERIYMNVDIRL